MPISLFDLAYEVPIIEPKVYGERYTSIPFDATDPHRQRLASVLLSGNGEHRLSVHSGSAARETIAFLRFLDPAGNLVATRRLSIAPGQDATFDLDAYGLRGTFDLELVSFRPVTVSILEPRDRSTREVRRPQR